ncbi:MAG: ATP-dependent sacrificial sulfur transferase LarE [Nitrospirae bacterium]|nr:ATP-dependent sacrificial sulfur transferase LarE [Nitrospirota bacterium]
MKYQKLLSILREIESAVLAFSGGVDSTFLLKVMKESGVRTLAVTAYSDTMPAAELENAAALAGTINAVHRVITTDEMSNPDFTCNPRNRCFYCKDELFSRLAAIARAEEYRFVIDGSNHDDLADWRPGMQAAAIHGVRSPLLEAGLSKDEIRAFSKELGLPTWSKPASPCLSSRFPYGVRITKNRLKRVEEAESFLKKLGFGDLRVRSDGETAKIEVDAKELPGFFDKELRESVVRKLKALGFKYVSVDLEGFRSGKLNE